MKVKLISSKTHIVLSVIIGILVLVCVALSLSLLNARQQTVDVEYFLNKEHQKQITRISNIQLEKDKKIDSLEIEIETLRAIPPIIRYETIKEVDSVRLLPFSGKGGFFTTETARIDSIWKRYPSRDN